MKNGLILYLVGNPELPEEFDASAATQALGYAADRVELVSWQQGFFTVEDAWHFLLTQGCGRINLMVAQSNGPEQLQPLGPAVRLCG
jgi:hypothetical protein